MNGELAKKNRDRSPYSFANINLLGNCNVNCYFCLGKDLNDEFAKYNSLHTHWSEWENWDKFIETCKTHNIPQIYLTGQNTDSLMYKYTDSLFEEIKRLGFHIGLRTNGLLAKKKIDLINSCTTCFGDAVSYSIHTLDKDTQIKIWETPLVPDWDWILRNTTSKMRVSIVLNRYNKDEVLRIIEFLSNYDNVEYIQVRKVCTDTRYELLEEDMILFEELEQQVKCQFVNVGSFETANTYLIYGKNVSFWRTVGTTVNSINYFTNGVLSEEYFIIEGYSTEKGISLT